MDCPRCKKYRCKRHWRPSQWCANYPHGNPVAGGYTQCKVCDGECDEPQYGSYQTTYSPEKRAAVSFMNLDLAYEIQFVLACVNCIHPTSLGPFVELWMSHTSQRCRKQLSYYGAIEQLWSTDPAHYTHEVEHQDRIEVIRYYDPCKERQRREAGEGCRSIKSKYRKRRVW